MGRSRPGIPDGMSEGSTEHGHGGDAGVDEPDVGQTSTEDLGQDAAGTDDEAEQGSGARDDDLASGHLGEPGGPTWARRDGED